MRLSNRVQLITESATMAVTARAAQLKREGVDVVTFGAGEPQDFPTPPHVVEAAQKALSEGWTRYPKPSSGIPLLREAICTKLERDNHLDYTPHQVVVSVGGKDACYMILHTLINPGEEVIIPVPYWVSYPEMVRLAGGVPVLIHGDPGNGLRVTPEQIRNAVTERTRVLILNYPSNPGGHMYDPQQVRAIADMLADTQVNVISDEIYDRLVYGQRKFLSFAAAGEDAYHRTVTINSASKAYSMPGWRIGFAAGPTDVIAAVAKFQSQNTSGAATFTQIAYAAALAGDQSCVDQMCEEFERRGRYMYERLSALPGVDCREPEGAFYCFPDVSATFERLGVNSSHTFAAKLLNEAHVALVPGGAFGMDGHVRLSFAASMDQIEKGLTRLATFLSKT
jgi:aspartate aminotransferase